MNAVKVGEYIAIHRKALNLTQKDIAEKLHVSVAAVSKWERGLNFPDISLLEPLATLLELSVPDLLGLETQSAEQMVRDVTDLAVTQQRASRSESRRIVVGVCALAFAVLSYAILMVVREGAVLSDLAIALIGNGLLTYPALCLGVVSWSTSLIGLLWRGARWIWWCGSALLFCAASLYAVIFTLDIYMCAQGSLVHFWIFLWDIILPLPCYLLARLS